MDTIGIEAATKNLDFDVDASATIEPVEFELLTHQRVIERVAAEMEAEVRAMQGPFDDMPKVPDDFVRQVVDDFFSPLPSLPFLFEKKMGLSDIQWKAALARQPLLSDPIHLGVRRDDAALAFHLRLTAIEADTSRLEINVDTVSATLLAVLRSGQMKQPHPVASLRDDFVPAGYIIPSWDLRIDVSDIDVDLDLGNVLLKPLEFLAEQSLEALGNYLKDDLAEDAVERGMEFLEDRRLEIGGLITSVMREIANRNHVFRRLRVENDDWVIETLDPAQLAVPFVEPDGIDHRFDEIDEELPALEPIDGPMPADAGQRLGRVDHLVFLMMENRSFDHMLGYLSHPSFGGRGDVDGLDGRAVALGGEFTGTTATPQPNPRNAFAPDPGHGAATVAAQIAGGAMNGFVSEFVHRLEGAEEINLEGNLNDPERVLRFHTPEQLLVFDRLTRTDLVLDRWFSSIPGPTFPNRACYYAGFTPTMSQAEIFADAGYLSDLTLFDLLDREGVDWILYESGVSFLRMFKSYRLETTRIRPIEELYARTAALPRVTFIDPKFTGSPGTGPSDDDHPPTDIAAGQEFVRRVIEALQDLPSWPKTLLVITYDEHGGFADHVPPPGTERSQFPPTGDGTPSVLLAHPDAGSFGVRVPTFVVSPLITAGDVGHRVYDHASCYRTIVERFLPQRRNSAILPDRVRQARHLGELVEPGIAGGGTAPRFSGQLLALAPEPDAVLRRDSDDFRPYLAAPPDKEDFGRLMTSLGNPVRGGV